MSVSIFVAFKTNPETFTALITYLYILVTLSVYLPITLSLYSLLVLFLS